MILNPEPREMVRPYDVATRGWIITGTSLALCVNMAAWFPSQLGQFCALIVPAAIAAVLHYIGARNAIRKYEKRQQDSAIPRPGPVS